MKNKKTNSLTQKDAEYFYEVFCGMKFALINAGRQLELCGWCPRAENNDLDGYFPNCETARKKGVLGCHECIADHFITESEAQ